VKTRGTVLKWAAVSGALDDLPLDALKLYLLLLGRGFSREDCQQALAVLAAHDLLTWAPVLPRPSRRQRAPRGRERLEIVFQLHLPCA
jgi:hypothetical protein